MKEATSRVLRKCGIPADILGWAYAGRAIEMVMDNWDLINQLTKKLYPSIAKEFNTTASRVERAIRHAVEVGFNTAPYDELKEIFGNTIRPDTGKVTNGAFIATVADILIHEVAM